MRNLEFWHGRRSPRSYIGGSWLNDVWGLIEEADKHSKSSATNSLMSAPCDVMESENHYELSFDVPGVDQDKLNIEITGRNLVVSGERTFKHETEGGHVFRSERRHGKFERSFELPEGADADSVVAQYNNGVLSLTIAKPTVEKTKKISISSTPKNQLKNLTGKKPHATEVVNS